MFKFDWVYSGFEDEDDMRITLPVEEFSVLLPEREDDEEDEDIDDVEWIERYIEENEEEIEEIIEHIKNTLNEGIFERGTIYLVFDNPFDWSNLDPDTFYDHLTDYIAKEINGDESFVDKHDD